MPRLIPNQFHDESDGLFPSGRSAANVRANDANTFPGVPRAFRKARRFNLLQQQRANLPRIIGAHLQYRDERYKVIGRAVEIPALLCALRVTIRVNEQKLHSPKERLELRREQSWVFMDSQQAKDAGINLACWVVLVGQVAIGAERKQVQPIAVRAVFVDMMQLWLVRSADSATVVELFQYRLLHGFWYGFSLRFQLEARWLFSAAGRFCVHAPTKANSPDARN